MESKTKPLFHKDFKRRRIHSLMGFLLVIYIIEHLLTNSRAALLFGEDGRGFISTVNAIHSLPYLYVIEVSLIAIPLLYHSILGISYLFTGKINSGKTDGSSPSLPDYPRNKAYTWQRLTAWVLLLGIILHVIDMRFLAYPKEVRVGGNFLYITTLNMDTGLYTVADRLGVKLYNSEQIENERLSLSNYQGRLRKGMRAPVSWQNPLQPVIPEVYQEAVGKRWIALGEQYDQRRFVRALEKGTLTKTQVKAVAPSIGTAILLTVRNTFKDPLICLLYAIFVPAATYHAFNGLWTFLITWGVTLTPRSQALARTFSTVLMLIFTSLGWVAIFCTYWVNLRY